MARHRRIYDETFEERLAREQLEAMPRYPDIPGAKKYRKIARTDLTPEQKAEYSAVIVKTVLTLQRKELLREVPDMKPRCASGTFINNGRDLHDHLVKQRRASLARVPDQERAKRTDRQLIEQYEAAMAEKRAREAASQETK